MIKIMREREDEGKVVERESKVGVGRNGSGNIYSTESKGFVEFK